MTGIAKTHSPDYILYNGNFITMNPEQEHCNIITIQDGKITGTFDSYAESFSRGFHSRMIDLKGKTVLPGFIDCNVHLIQSGLQKYCIEVYTDTKESFLQKLQKEASEFKDGEWVWCVGYNDEIEDLTRWDLDKISPNHPIVISKNEFHITIVNTLAYRLLQIPRSVSGTSRNADGVPTGVLAGEASGFARRKLFMNLIDDNLREKILQQMDYELIANGITTVNAMEGGPFFADQDIDAVNRYKSSSMTEILLFPQTMMVDTVLEKSLPRIGGNIYLDGSIGAKKAAITDNYVGDTQNGTLYYSQEDVDDFILNAHKRGLQISVSCIGNRAINQALHAFQKAFYAEGMKNHRHRIELFVMPDKEQINLAIALGLILSMRPNYDKLNGGAEGIYKKNIGELHKNCNPLASVVQRGGILCCGSEHSVTPLNPFVSISSCVLHSEPKERLTVYEALQTLTVNAAYANFAEERIGKIQRGFDADLIAVSEDPFTAAPEDIENIRTIMTMKKGKILYHERGLI